MGLAGRSRVQRFFLTSPVVLAAGRIWLALLLLVDVVRRLGDLDVWYTNQGLMPNHTMLWAPQARLGWSVFFGVSELHEARFVVALIVLVYVGLLVGYRTKLMQVLALLAHASLDCRVHFLINGGDAALSVLLAVSAARCVAQCRCVRREAAAISTRARARWNGESRHRSTAR